MKANDWPMPVYPMAFPLDDAYSWACGEFFAINEAMDGRIASTQEDAAILAQAVKNAGDGNHLEIGTLYGGSAIVAALTKKTFNLSGMVVCVDDMRAVPEVQRSPETILANAERLGVRDRIRVITANSRTWKPDRLFQSAYIDASHDYISCKADFETVRKFTARYAIFHDFDPAHPGVILAVREAWPLVYLAHHTAVTERP